MKITIKINTAADKITGCIARARSIIDALDDNAARMPSGPPVTPPAKTIRIGNYDVPVPYRGVMEVGRTYYVPDALRRKYQYEDTWGADEYDKCYMQRGFIHLTAEAAALHGKALASLTAGEGVEQ